MQLPPQSRHSGAQGMHDARQPTYEFKMLQQSGSGPPLMLERGRRCRQQPLQQLSVVSSFSFDRQGFV